MQFDTNQGAAGSALSTQTCCAAKRKQLPDADCDASQCSCIFLLARSFMTLNCFAVVLMSLAFIVDIGMVWAKPKTAANIRFASACT